LIFKTVRTTAQRSIHKPSMPGGRIIFIYIYIHRLGLAISNDLGDRVPGILQYLTNGFCWRHFSTSVSSGHVES